jgi:polysaccharide biosynthesis protein PelF
MEITLVTEGTYPLHMGGVSVWCDQLIRGLPDLRFRVHAIASNDDERVTWILPENVASFERTTLWSAETVRSSSLPPGGRFGLAHDRLCRALIQPEGAGDEFLAALSELFQYAQERDLETAILANSSVQHLLDVWLEDRRNKRRALVRSRDEDIKPSLSDALDVSRLLAHLLRPLSHQPVRTDLVHCVSNGLAALVGLAHKWTHGTPLILTEHGVYLRERYLAYTNAPYSFPVRALTLAFYKLLSNAAYSVADLITPGSEYNRRWELRGGASASKIRPVYNGINLAEFPVPKLEPELPTITWLGRIDPIKDVHTLLRSFALVRQEVRDARLRIFGPTPHGNEAYAKSCHDLARELGLDGAATFEGRVDSTLDAYHAGQIYVLSSISEGFPFSLLEAMATGRPVIATDVGGVREAVGEAGVVVPPRDHDAMAQACIRLLEREQVRRNFGAAARTRVQTQFSLDLFLETYRHIYTDMVRPRARRNPTLEAFIRYGRDGNGTQVGGQR